MCGNGIIISGEDCEDGNLPNGDCCNSSCQYDAPGTACSNPPSDPCNPTPACDGAGECGRPPTTCKNAPKSLFIARSGRLDWKWLKGQATAFADFADPTTTTDYTLCVDAIGPINHTFRFSVYGAGGLPDWRVIGASAGYLFKDESGFLSPDGITKVNLKSGDEGKAKILVKHSGFTFGQQVKSR